jgi:hypothetical protein
VDCLLQSKCYQEVNRGNVFYCQKESTDCPKHLAESGSYVCRIQTCPSLMISESIDVALGISDLLTIAQNKSKIKIYMSGCSKSLPPLRYPGQPVLRMAHCWTAVCRHILQTWQNPPRNLSAAASHVSGGAILFCVPLGQKIWAPVI